jgi:hypothetical protein
MKTGANATFNKFLLVKYRILYLGILPLRIRRAEDSPDSSKPLPFLTHNWYHFSPPSPKSTRTDQNTNGKIRGKDRQE